MRLLGRGDAVLPPAVDLAADEPEQQEDDEHDPEVSERGDIRQAPGVGARYAYLVDPACAQEDRGVGRGVQEDGPDQVARDPKREVPRDAEARTSQRVHEHASGEHLLTQADHQAQREDRHDGADSAKRAAFQKPPLSKNPGRTVSVSCACITCLLGSATVVRHASN